MSKKLIAPLAIAAGVAAGGYFLAPALFGGAAATGGAGSAFLFPGLEGATFASGASIPGLAGAAASGLPSWLSPALTIGGGAFQGYSALQQGKALEAAGRADQDAANLAAVQLNTKAGQERALAQREGAENRRRVELLSSKARAIAAAGGSSLSDPGIVNTISDLDAEADYRFRLAMGEGESKAQTLETAAQAKTTEGQNAALAGGQARQNSYLSAGGTIAGAAGNALLSKYASSKYLNSTYG